MFIYMEYVSRRRGIPLEGFHQVYNAGQTEWDNRHSDRMILNMARTWRIGPEPEYLSVWYNANAGVELLTDWERIFRSGQEAYHWQPFQAVARIDRAGCYEPLIEPVPGTGGPYYAEYFDWVDGATSKAVKDLFDERRRVHPDLRLNVLVDRIGALGPDPRGIAIWSLPGYGSLNEIARELTSPDTPIRLQDVGLYADTGQEVL